MRPDLHASRSPFDRLRVSGIHPLVVSLSNHERRLRPVLIAVLSVALCVACEKAEPADPLTVRTGALVGIVLVHDQPVAGVQVTIEGTGVQTATDESGAFRLDLVPAGEGKTFVVEFVGPDGSSFNLRRSMDVTSGETADMGTLSLSPSASLAGSFILSDRSRHDGIVVYVEGTSIWTRTAFDGSYAIPRLAPGAYRLVALAPGYESRSIEEFDLPPGDDLTLPAVGLSRLTDRAPGGAISGFVHSPVGRPLEGAVVSLTPPLQSSVTGEDGSYQFVTLPPASYLVTASLEGKVTNSVKAAVAANETATVNIPLFAQPNQDKAGKGGWNSPPSVFLVCPTEAMAGVPIDIQGVASEPDGDTIIPGTFSASGGSLSDERSGVPCEGIEAATQGSDDDSDRGAKIEKRFHSPSPERSEGDRPRSEAQGVTQGSHAECVSARWTPPGQPGLSSINFNVSDGQLTSKAACEIAVSAESKANECPSVAIAGRTRALAGRSLALAVDAFDPDGDPLSLNWAVTGGSLAQRTGDHILWTAPKEMGEHLVTVCASDGRCPRSCGSARLSVADQEKEKKVLPACAISGPTAARIGSVVTFEAATYDPNAFPVKVRWAATGGSFAVPDGALAAWTAPREPGVQTISAVATAASGSTATCQIGIFVLAAERANSCAPLHSEGQGTTVLAIPVRVEFTTADDEDSSAPPLGLTCQWPNGIFQTAEVKDSTALFEWAPLLEGVHLFSCRATESACPLRRYHALTISARPDDLPPFAGLSCTAGELLPGQSTLCVGFGKDAKDQPVTYRWSAAGGFLSSSTDDTLMWTAPREPGEYQLTLAVSDGSHEARSSHVVRVLPTGGPRAAAPTGSSIEGEYGCDAQTVALYHLNETEGTVAQDACGSNHAVVHGAAMNHEARFDIGFSFDGWNNSVEIPAAAVTGLSNGTLEAWVRLDATWRDYDLFYRRREGDDCDFRIRYTARTQSWGSTWNNECADIHHKLDRNTATDFGWHHVAVTWDGTLWKMYQDGLLRILAPDIYSLDKGAEPLVVGRSITGPGHPLYGQVDEIRISDRAREPEEFRILASPVSPLWTTKTSMPTARPDAGAALVEGKLYVIGGRHTDGTALASNEAFDVFKDAWTVVKDMPTARWDAAVASVGRRIYAIGGARFTKTQEVVSRNEEYETADDVWTRRSDWPRPRFGAAAAALDQGVYVIGGSKEFGDAGALASNDLYDPRTDLWAERAPMPTARAHAAVVARGGSLYVLGGKNEEGFRASVERYDPRSDAWTILAPMPTGRMSAGAVVLNDFIYVIGGENESLSDWVIAYDPNRDAWTPLDPLDAPRSRFVAAAFQRLVLLVGGYDGGNPLSTVSQGFLFSPLPK